MFVPERMKRAFYHAVLKVIRRSEAGDSNSHAPPPPEVLGSPLNFLAVANQAGCHASDGLLLCGDSRPNMKIYVAGQIKASLDRRIDFGLKNDFRLRRLLMCRPAGALDLS
jgi:hypothetical protein